MHQPRADIFRLFDGAALLTRGRVAYFGAAAEMVDYFGSAGFLCPMHTNPADFFLDI